jgi:hypothetical protein
MLVREFFCNELCCFVDANVDLSNHKDKFNSQASFIQFCRHQGAIFEQLAHDLRCVESLLCLCEFCFDVW